MRLASYISLLEEKQHQQVILQYTFNITKIYVYLIALKHVIFRTKLCGSKV